MTPRTTHNPQVTYLTVTSWDQLKIFILLSVGLRDKAGRRNAFSALSQIMAAKMQKITGKVNSLGLNVPFFNPATLWKSLLRLYVSTFHLSYCPPPPQHLEKETRLLVLRFLVNKQHQLQTQTTEGNVALPQDKMTVYAARGHTASQICVSCCRPGSRRAAPTEAFPGDTEMAHVLLREVTGKKLSKFRMQ